MRIHARTFGPSQIEDILVGDKQLAKEILYDMRQAEAAKAAEARAPPPPEAAVAGTPLAGGAAGAAAGPQDEVGCSWGARAGLGWRTNAGTSSAVGATCSRVEAARARMPGQGV